MRIGMGEVISGIENAAAIKITRELEKEGFKVVREEFLEDSRMCLDLYAEKGDDRRIYEFKIEKNKQNSRLDILQQEAKRRKAKLYVIYLQVPRSKEIEYEGLEDIIYEDLVDDFPSELDMLSTHTRIDSVDNIEIDSIQILQNCINMRGSGSINLYLQWGTDREVARDEGLVIEESKDFYWEISVDRETERIVEKEYKIDLEEEY